MMDDWTPIVVEMLLLVPFFGWGVYTVYARLQKRMESNILVDGATAIAVVLFLAFQVEYLGSWGRNYPVEYVLSMLGLIAAAAALYGHVVYALATQVMTELAHPTRDDTNIEPRWGAAEARERVDDFPGALAEYFKLLRRHPKHVLLNVRIAEALIQIGRSAEAPPYFRTALDQATSADRQLAVVNRLCDLYVGVLGEPERAERSLEDFIERNPRGPQAEAARHRLERLELDLEAPPEPPLDSLVVHPVEEQQEEELLPAGEDTKDEPLESLDEHPLYGTESVEDGSEQLDVRDASHAARAPSVHEGLASLDSEPVEVEGASVDADRPSRSHADESATSGESAIERM